MKKIKYVVLALVVVLSVFLVYMITSKDKDTDAVKFKNEYEVLNGTMDEDGKAYLNISISKDNTVKYTNFNQIFDILDNGSGIIYLGYPTSSWCRLVVPTLLKFANDNDKDIYYMNVLNDYKLYQLEQDSNYIKLFSLLNKYINLSNSNGDIIHIENKEYYLPLIVFVSDGSIKGVISGVTDEINDPYITLTNDVKQKLTNLYESYIVQSNTCSVVDPHC